MQPCLTSGPQQLLGFLSCHLEVSEPHLFLAEQPFRGPHRADKRVGGPHHHSAAPGTVPLEALTTHGSDPVAFRGGPRVPRRDPRGRAGIHERSHRLMV